MRATERPWAELVFHVLAHLPRGAHLAPSLHDDRYVEQVEGLLGPASARPLGDDAAALDAVLTSHDRMVAVQMLAWLFDSLDQAQAVADRALAELHPGQVARPELLPLVQGDAAELLFCAALLELDAFSRLPPVADVLVPAAVEALTPLAPWLGRCGLAQLRPLGLRGRVAFGEIWVGVPGWGQASTERCAWQAAHEACVLEVSERCPEVASSHDAREELAWALLGRRAEAAGQAEAHTRWQASFAPPAAVLGEALEPLLAGLTSPGSAP